MTQSALEPTRAWALYGFVSACFLFFAAIVILIGHVVQNYQGDTKPYENIFGLIYFFLVTANFSAIGIDLFQPELLAASGFLGQTEPRVGHLLWLVCLGAWPWLSWVFALPLVLVFSRQSLSERRQSLTRLAVLASFVSALPLVATPWIFWGWYQDEPVVIEHPELPLRQRSAPSNILLVTFDAWRYRSTSFSRSLANVDTPHLLALANESIVFTQARSASDSTMVSLASIFSGLYPPQVRSISSNHTNFLRSESWPSLPYFLKKQGYRTAAVAATIDPRELGIAQDFSRLPSPQMWRNFNQKEFLPLASLAFWLPRWTHRSTPPFLSVYMEDGRMITRDLIRQACESIPEKPALQFTWVHIPVPHAPYRRFPEDSTEKNKRFSDENDCSETDYEEYVKFSDSALGMLVTHLKSLGKWQDTLTIVTSDHGEAFQKGYPCGHGHGVPSDDLTRVPMLIHFPAQKKGQIYSKPVSHVDILPTILDSVSGSYPAYLPGQSLRRPGQPTRVVHTWMRSFIDKKFPRVVVSTDGDYDYELWAGEERLEKLFLSNSKEQLPEQEHDSVMIRFRTLVARDCPPIWMRPGTQIKGRG